VWIRLAHACRAAASPSRARLDEIVRLAAAACGAERAFLVRARDRPDHDPFHIVAVSTTRRDGSRVPSRSIVQRAIAGRRPMLLLDAEGEFDSTTASVRSLGLRSILSAPVPPPAPEQAAIVLDSRNGFRLSAPDLREAINAFAGIIALAWGNTSSEARGAAGRADDAVADLPYVSSAHRAMMGWVVRIAPTGLPVLVRGESGSGKEGVSRALHRLGPRHAGPFVAINCTAVTETLLEAELFGAARGAYTGAHRDRPGLFRQADGGTLFLDEVGDMPPAMQSKLLRVLDAGRVRPVGGVSEKPVDVRVIAATHRDLLGRVDDGRFRADLYYRLAVLRVDVPPLRRRLDDLPALIGDLAARLQHETGCASVRLAADAWGALRAYSWPGNIRELHAALARAVLRSHGGEIHAAHLALPSGGVPPRPAPRVSLERQMIEAALRDADGSIKRAASRIGWSRQKLYRRMEDLAVPRGDQDRRGTTSSDSSTFQ
jgi:DNA-binding NtrC family response regulator